MTESWTDTLIPMTPNSNNIWNSVRALLTYKDSVLAIGTMGLIHQDSLFILKADTITWQFKPITFNAPDIKIKSPYSGKNIGNTLYLSYGRQTSSFSYHLIKSTDGGHHWSRVCMGSASFEILNNELYTINELTDSLSIFRRSLPDTTIQVIGAGLHKKSLDWNNSKFYVHQNTLYFNGQDGVYQLNGLIWEKVGLWEPYTLGTIYSLLFQEDTIWASTSRGLFWHSPASFFWEARSNGINTDGFQQIQLSDVQGNKILYNRIRCR